MPSIGQGTWFECRVLDRVPDFSAEFWTGYHFWVPSIGQGTRFECRILDHYYENFEEKVKNKALNEKLKFGTNCIAFLDLFYVTYVKIGFGDMIPLIDFEQLKYFNK